MTPRQVIKYFGTQSAAAVACRRTQPAVANWLARGRVPQLAQLELEEATDGKLKADRKRRQVSQK